MTRNEFICGAAPLLLASKNFHQDKIMGEACVKQAILLADVLEVNGVATWKSENIQQSAQKVLQNRPRAANGPGSEQAIAQTSVQIFEPNHELPLPPVNP